MRNIDPFYKGLVVLKKSQQDYDAQDPCLEKYYPTSPYSYCGGNPIRYIDPTGCDTVRVNENGTFVPVAKTDDDFDMIVGRDGATIQVQKGCTDSFYNSDINIPAGDDGDEGIQTKVSLYDASEDGLKFFQFVAQNSSVEWSIYISENKIVVGTSHYLMGDNSINHLSKEYLNTVSKFYHSHPYNGGPSKPDIDKAREIEELYPQMEMRIFKPAYGSYLLFNSHSKWDREELPMLVVMGTRLEKDDN